MEHEPRQTIFAEWSEKILEQIENGTAPWQRPWSGKAMAQQFNPVNPLTGTKYKGMNRFILSGSSDVDNRWMTFGQIAKNNYKLRKGSKGTRVTYFEKREPSQDEKGEAQGPSFILKTYIVFNASNIEGLEPLRDTTQIPEGFDRFSNVEKLIQNYGIHVKHGGNRAYYSPGEHSITMPPKESFHSPEDYFSTLLHEVAHSTGPELKRDMSGSFGSESYAKEELTAEWSSLLLAASLGIGKTESQLGNNSAYLAHWKKIIKDDDKALFKAIAQAEKVNEHVLQFAPEKITQTEVKAEPRPMDGLPMPQAKPTELTPEQIKAPSETLEVAKAKVARQRKKAKERETEPAL